jgi:hypothetical protein
MKPIMLYDVYNVKQNMLKHFGVGTTIIVSTGNIENNAYLWRFYQGVIDLRRGRGEEGVVL